MDALSYLNNLYGVSSKEEKNSQKEPTVDTDKKTARKWNDEVLKNISGNYFYQEDTARELKNEINPQGTSREGTNLKIPNMGLISTEDEGFKSINPYDDNENQLLSDEALDVLDDINLNGNLFDKEIFKTRIDREINKLQNQIKTGEIEPDIAREKINILKQQLTNPDLDFVKEYIDPTAVGSASTVNALNMVNQSSPQEDVSEGYYKALGSGFMSGVEDMKHQLKGMVFDALGLDHLGKIEHFLSKQSDFLANHSLKYDTDAQKLALEIEDKLSKGNYLDAFIDLTTKGLYYAPHMLSRSAPALATISIASTINPVLGASLIGTYGLADGNSMIRDRVEENGGKDIPEWQKASLLAAGILNQYIQFGAFKLGLAGKITEGAEGKIVELFDRATGKKLASLKAKDLKNVNILPASRKVEFAKNAISSVPHMVEASVEEAGAEWIDGFLHEFATKINTEKNQDLDKVIEDSVRSANLQGLLGAMGGLSIAELGSGKKVFVDSLFPKLNPYVTKQIDDKIFETMKKPDGVDNLKTVYEELTKEKENIKNNLNLLNGLEDKGFESIFNAMNNNNINKGLVSKLFNISLRATLSDPEKKQTLANLIKTSFSSLDESAKEKIVSTFQQALDTTQSDGKIIDLEEALKSKNEDAVSTIISSLIAKDPSILLSINEYANKENDTHVKTFIDKFIDNLKSNPEFHEELNQIFKLNADKLIKRYEKDVNNANAVFDYTLGKIKEATGIDFGSNNRTNGSVLPEVDDNTFSTINFNEFESDIDLEPTSEEFKEAKQTFNTLHDLKLKLTDNNYTPTKEDIETLTDAISKANKVKFSNKEAEIKLKNNLAALTSRLINRLSNIDFTDIKNNPETKEKVSNILDSLYTLEKNKHIFGSSLFEGFDEDGSMLGGKPESKNLDIEKIISSTIEQVVNKVLAPQNDKLAQALDRIANILEKNQHGGSSVSNNVAKKALKTIVENDIKNGDLSEAMAIIADPTQAIQKSEIKKKLNAELFTEKTLDEHIQKYKGLNLKTRYDIKNSYSSRHVAYAVQLSRNLKHARVEDIVKSLKDELFESSYGKPGLATSDDGFAVKMLKDNLVGSKTLEAIESSIKNIDDEAKREQLLKEFEPIKRVLSNEESFKKHIEDIAKQYESENLLTGLFNEKVSKTEPTSDSHTSGSKETKEKSLFDFSEEKEKTKHSKEEPTSEEKTTTETKKESSSTVGSEEEHKTEKEPTRERSDKTKQILKEKEQVIDNIINKQTDVKDFKIEDDNTVISEIAKEIKTIEKESEEINKQKTDIKNEIKKLREEIRNIYSEFNKDINKTKDKELVRYFKNDFAILKRALNKLDELEAISKTIKTIDKNKKSLESINKEIEDIKDSIEEIATVFTNSKGKNYKDVKKLISAMYQVQYDNIQKAINKINDKMKELNCK